MDDYSDNIDQQLLEAYLNTDYRIDNPAISVRIGQTSALLDRLLMDNNAYSWCMISAWNPYSKEFPKSLNEERHQNLVKMLEKEHYSFKIGWGIPKDQTWQAEKLLLIIDISYARAIEIGKTFEQNAIIFGYLNEASKLVFCNSG